MVTQPKTSNQFARNVFKADSKRAIQKTEEKTKELPKFQKFQTRIIQKKLQIKMIKNT